MLSPRAKFVLSLFTNPQPDGSRNFVMRRCRELGLTPRQVAQQIRQGAPSGEVEELLKELDENFSEFEQMVADAMGVPLEA